MRRLFLNLSIALLTFVAGLGLGAIQNIFTPSNKEADYTSVTLKPSESVSPTKAAISGGVLNGKALYLPQPEYPAVAKAAEQEGNVVVQVTIDEQGYVTAARAVGGPPLLQAAAVEAATRARFSPTKLSGQPVKITGVINYNFVLK